MDIIHKTSLFIMLCLSVSGLTAQNGQTLTLDIKGSLQDIVKEIERQSKYSFVYSENIDMKQSGHITLKNVSLEECLGRLFRRTGITWQISEKHIILNNLKHITVSGYIFDSKSKESLIGASIADRGTNRGSFTNSYGYYTMQVSPGEMELQASYIGYSSITKEVKLKYDTIINFYLPVTDTYLKEIMVYDAKTFSPSGSSMELFGSTIKSMPATFAESDVLKSLQFIPGIQSGVEGTSGVYVRGGSPDQNLILIDGVPVYNTGHVLGLFSVFNTDAIKKVSLHKGSFPARFGGRLSSVIDIRLKDGDMQNYHASASIGLLAAHLNVEGPIIKDKTSFSFSARRSYIDGFMRIARKTTNDNVPVFYIYDINAKVNHKFSDRSRLYLSLYEGCDALNTREKYKTDEAKKYNQTKLDYKWGNTIASLRWNYVFSNKLFMNTTLAYNKYKFKFKSHIENWGKDDKSRLYSNFQYSGIEDWQTGADFEYTPDNNHRIRFGGGLTFHRFSPEIHGSKEKETNKDDYETETNYYLFDVARGREMALYAEDEFPITGKLKANLGLHFSLINTQGKTYQALQPRVSLGYQFNEKFAVRSSYTKMNQYVNLLTSSATSQPTDLWVPITRNLKPMSSHQFTAGAFMETRTGYSFSIEGFYKKMNNVLEYKDGASWKDAYTSWEDQVEAGKGWGYGVELFARKTTGRLTGWLGYTLSWNDRQFKTINYGKRFPAKYDRRHDFNIIGTFKLNTKIDLSASWMYATGNNITLMMEEYQSIDPEGSLGMGTSIPYVEQRNNYRLSATHHLDIDMKYAYSSRKIWTFGIYNVYNRQNPYLAMPGYSKKTEGKMVVYEYNFLGIVPSVSFTYKFK